MRSRVDAITSSLTSLSKRMDAFEKRRARPDDDHQGDPEDYKVYLRKKAELEAAKGKDEWRRIVSDYANYRSGGTHTYNVASKSEALRKLYDVMVERSEAADKRKIINRLYSK